MVSTADYHRLQLNGLQIGQPGTAILTYGKTHHNRGRNQSCHGQPKTTPDNPCPTCGQPLAPEHPCTTHRDGRTFTTQISRCSNKRQKCPPQIIETEITDMATRPGPMTPRSQEWIDSVNERRTELNLTIRALADAAGIHKSVIQRAISRDYGASDATVFAIDHALLTASLAKDEAALDQECTDPATPPKPDNSSTWQHEWTGKRITEPSHTIAALQERTATLAGQQDRFWCELSEAMKRLTETESELARHGMSIDGLKDAHESLTDACTLRIGNLEHRANTQHSEFAAFRDAANESSASGPLSAYVAQRITINEAEINNLAKSVERLSIDDTGHVEKLADYHIWLLDHDSRIAALAKTVEVRCCTHADTDHDNAIAFLEMANQQLASRIASLEARDTERFAMRVIECLAGRLG